MIKIGLTGAPGTGKTESAKILSQFGASVIYADLINRELYKQGQSGYKAVLDIFGREILCGNGRIDRHALAEKVFSDPIERKKLEKAVWPIMAQEFENQFSLMETSDTRVAVLEAAVLFEAGWDSFVDEVWTITAPKTLTLKWLKENGKMMPRSVQAREMAQFSTKEKIRRSHRVISNDNNIENLRSVIKMAWLEVVNNIPCSNNKV